MNDRRLLMALAGVFATLAVLLLFLGVTVTPVAIGVALPFGGVAYLLWYHATGRLEERAYEQARATGTATGNGAGSARSRRAQDARRRAAEARMNGGRGAGSASGNRRRRARAGDRARRPEAERMSAAEARNALGVGPNADESAVRRAYRERVKDVHPDRGGDEETFRRVQRAYERLRE